MPSPNTLDLAKQGDPEAIATILTYHLTQRYNMTASAIRLGNYLSVLVEAAFPPDQYTMVGLVQDIVQGLAVAAITIVEISARQIGDHEVLWSQTIELLSDYQPTAMNDEISMPSSVTRSDLSPLETVATEATMAENSVSNFSPSDIVPSPIDPESTPSPPAAIPQPTKTESPLPSEPQTPSVATASTPPETRQDEWQEILDKLMERPEMLAIVAFALVVACWDAYIDWMMEADPAQPLSGRKLAHRLGVTYRTLDRYKSRPNFSSWSQELDPDGIAWSYENNRFIPKAPL
jgi:hypothetical protein